MELSNKYCQALSVSLYLNLSLSLRDKADTIIKLNPVETETTKSNKSDNFLPVAREADLSTGPT